MKYAPAVYLLDGATKATEWHTTVHLLDEAGRTSLLSTSAAAQPLDRLEEVAEAEAVSLKVVASYTSSKGRRRQRRSHSSPSWCRGAVSHAHLLDRMLTAP